jgi:CheY-like chemotaxis protein
LARILYIEDYQPAAMTMRFVMEELGHECVVAPTGRAAIDLYGTQTFDLALIDNQLPDIQGPEVARAIRALEREKGLTPTVLVAYSAGNRGYDSYREDGMDGFAMKSLSLGDVQALLRQYLKT